MSERSVNEVAARPSAGSLGTVTALLAELDENLRSNGSSAYESMTRAALRRIGAAAAASVATIGQNGFRTVATTDDRAASADAIQHELGLGPCVDPMYRDPIYWAADLRAEERWPEFGAQVADRVGFLSMLSYRLNLEPEADETVAALNVYAVRTNAFDQAAAETGLLLALHGSLAIAAESHRGRVRHLERALVTSRDIGVAMGVLMNKHKIGRDRAFDLLRIASQNSNRKLHDVASVTAETGSLPAAESAEA